MNNPSLRDFKEGNLPILVIGAILLLVGGIFVFNKYTDDSGSREERQEEVDSDVVLIPEGVTRHPLSGEYLEEENLPQSLFGVMVENSAEAWPLSGLAKANLVIEAPVEGNIPRFLVFFDDTQRVDQIGPVRSARPYYVRWAQGFNAMYTHVGGSPEALGILRANGMNQLNEFFWGKFFWRADYRYAPHNVYISVERLKEAFSEREFKQDEIPLWTFQESTPDGGQQGEYVSIPFSGMSGLYTASWEYDEKQSGYLRYQGSKKHEDTSGDDVYAQNVVILFTGITTIDNEGRKSVTTIGEGRALFFRDGFVYEGGWQKKAEDKPLEFFTDKDQEFTLSPGKTWIEVVPLSTDIQIGTQE